MNNHLETSLLVVQLPSDIVFLAITSLFERDSLAMMPAIYKVVACLTYISQSNISCFVSQEITIIVIHRESIVSLRNLSLASQKMRIS